MQQEADYFEALEQVRQYSLEDHYLVLYTQEEVARLRFVPIK
jgi:heat shock protein HslJ